MRLLRGGRDGFHFEFDPVASLLVEHQRGPVEIKKGVQGWIAPHRYAYHKLIRDRSVCKRLGRVCKLKLDSGYAGFLS